VAETQHNFFAPKIDAGSKVLEFWKPVTGYEGLYEISNYGELKSLDKWVDLGLGRRQFVKGKIRAASVTSNGYRMTTLSKGGVNKTVTIQSLVVMHFIKNPWKKPIVNHRNTIKTDNYIGNLEWATYSENIEHAYRHNLRKAPCTGKFGKDHHRSRAICQLTLTGEHIREWDSISDAARELGIRGNGVQAVCAGKEKAFKGFIWKYK
jgi:hypothetical protein